jgi:Rrf2 family cysteine metabolism transcriptional repressor
LWFFAANNDLAKIMRELLDGPLGAGSESVFVDAAAAARAVLAKATIADVVDRENQAAGASMYYI